VLVLSACTLAFTSTAATAASDKVPVTRSVYGKTEPDNAPGQEMYLQQVVIAPGGKLPEHYHEGTQLATIRSGVLTYNVVTGTAVVTRGNGKTVNVKGKGVVSLRKGDTLVEAQSLVHYGSNKGKVPVVILLAALLHEGAPLSTPIGEGDPSAKPMHIETTLSSQSRTLRQVGADGLKTYGWNQLTGTSSLAGEPVEVELLGSVDYDNGSGPFSAFITFTYADGSTIATSAQGITSVDTATGTTTFAASLGVIGGTGTYAETTGSGTFKGARTTALGGDVKATFDLGLR
jgi:quercetin dioxygenase-like cupin family protein